MPHHGALTGREAGGSLAGQPDDTAVVERRLVDVGERVRVDPCPATEASAPARFASLPRRRAVPVPAGQGVEAGAARARGSRPGPAVQVEEDGGHVHQGRSVPRRARGGVAGARRIRVRTWIDQGQNLVLSLSSPSVPTFVDDDTLLKPHPLPFPPFISPLSLLAFSSDFSGLEGSELRICDS